MRSLNSLTCLVNNPGAQPAGDAGAVVVLEIPFPVAPMAREIDPAAAVYDLVVQVGLREEPFRCVPDLEVLGTQQSE